MTTDTGKSFSAAEQDELFAQAIKAGWNREMDWLWLETQLKNQAQQRYCLEQALHINPESETARRELRKLMAPQVSALQASLKAIVGIVVRKSKSAESSVQSLDSSSSQVSE